ncbi:MAG: hypothetical protein IKU31_05080, partial [Oscillospiraceae bacterium]|nr:hypothetical protein [Oscillospiraceae bacterium]
MTKRLISFLLVLCMLLTWLPISHAEETSYVVPEGAVEFCGNAYMVFNDSMTRTEAAAKCAEMGGRLVTITSQAENNFVVELLANAEKNCYWIGIEYDMDNGLWKLDDGEHTIAPYFNWAPNEPNFYGDYEEPYVHMFGKRHTGGNGLKEVGQWNDVSNEGAVYAHSFYDLKNFGYICEWGDEKITDMDGYGKFNGHTYQIYNCAPTWDEAKAHCEALGGHLATITSQEENDYLYHFIGSRNVTNAFFGYTDEAEEGTWVWVNGETSDYTNWHSGEPSNSNKKEHYAMFYKDFKDGTWNDD